ncbi:hypothetical protein [Chiayiivirga flava]|uniref:Uncharacterized protein n=1 Tax=Chiayiivirga flava TaxID=659595 RepID=A0A7W8D2I9_9GAMM|nr:hypothetical protein [Chiayiivirga flava]MBB5206704.1 hypothetical protein [Chiayiivirga flava]
MKTSPDISARSSDRELAGRHESSAWVSGRNCVYTDTGHKTYRVSIKTEHGWKTYGRFNDLETATYVANIAILVENLEVRYELNKEIGTKDRQELAIWRATSNNSDLEKIAASRFERVRIALESVREKERSEAEALLDKIKRARDRVFEEAWLPPERLKAIRSMSNDDLVDFIKVKKRGPEYDVAMAEAVRRFKRLDLPRQA